MMGFAAGDRLGNYRIVRPLGEGGMATVYEVEHVKLGVHYALKTFTLQEGHVELFRKRFAAEGKILARLNHPNLVRVIDLDIDEDAGIDLVSDLDAGTELDIKWKLARHEAAVEHALTKTALSKQSKEIYRAYVLEGLPIKEVAKRFGVSENVVSQAKTRVGKMIATLEEGLENG